MIFIPRGNYLREPRRGFLRALCLTLIFFRFGLVMTKVPLPKYSALNISFSAKRFLLLTSPQVNKRGEE